MGKSKLSDFDPEALLDPAPSSSSEGEESDLSGAEDTNAGREHYVDVGRSKLRKPGVAPLGPKYTSSRITRDVVGDDDSDDPFARAFDEEPDSEEEDAYVNGIADDGEIRQSEGEHDELDEDGDEDSDEELESAQSAGGENEEDEDENEDEDEEDDESEDESATQSAKVRELMQDSRSLTTSLAAAHQTDLSKAAAIKMQRKTFDALLNTRIKLQKALVSINSVAVDAYREETAPDASEAAEASALRLLSNLTDLRASLDEARTGQKRKRTSFISSTPPSEIWESIRASESRALPHRKAILERWSAKTRGASLASAKGRLNAGAQQSLTDVLSSQISNSQRLVERTTVPRSCAPQQLAAGSASDLNIYDDADFYGLLLKELLENRSSDLSSNGAAFVLEAPWRQAKTKRNVDTKASKGRKLRYTTHEKLENFMAPEDRGLWGDRQREELFSSLFGQRLGLGEHDEVESEQEDGIDAEEDGLMLFRS
ncbi:TRAUB-domain-containing protein [Trematosphaeria pertusa]|uniref:Protein BFR2 n=1 Tax=Trematosphaeria pertusa TaxID=390896 RepID=A0A6A6IIC4_9PLEO|nr:TRAUB-domain-containing protein [Trematosphaeria pertusa]KAF2250116.1 TRAUB-domain-containing protein [Trematosphaeria pertusa]